MRVFTWTATILVTAWYLRIGYRIDLEVYRLGVQAWLDGGDLYGTLPKTQVGIPLPFIYPPISAVLMAPMTVIPFALANVLLIVATVALTALTLAVVLSSLGKSLKWMALLPLALLIEPIRSTLDYGQINVILMAMVAADCLVRKPHWPRGVLVGLAAAIKLTPAAFILFFLLRRDFRASVTTVLSFLAATAVGFLLTWNTSIKFWTFAVFHTNEKVGTDYLANQSIHGVLARLGLGTGVWLALAVAVLTCTVMAMRRVEPTLAFSLNAVAMLLLSPISWSHHWVWCVPLLLALAGNGYRVLAATGAVVFVLAPHWWFPVQPWTGWQNLIGDAFFLYAVAVVGLVAYKEVGRRLAPLPDMLTPARQLA
ncbi:glycosyltransferase 87 family protein [Actinocrispum wychmicini]|uniref:Alpha-1,2-mannosyltransferase n=1 Tax=Actinocrispum wychmicini TaxID=1213861 RepID=A0A4R2JUW3_9PSEU|nr:glycosyltransferase 87 family protein [Actinocrispum wychmicini]TCO63007.1 alpha-1,2-mannosyltransferase [Actinocrispum wychmicini]